MTKKKKVLSVALAAVIAAVGIAGGYQHLYNG